eukprot:CAMPEP_0168494376 /NCGR_PEP_ID=MMETSP0228-20121227/71198_1 /TAXON_ID=133427 /ORGANISM="Protoceratium reticulatum, Strain CCCM 535 (=CCMP 1889)" /LENGTH=240 /DNA_ID=CAMNT_0008511179 /DNA_START=65 /DNA_END=787 /DNA_ORIENTATION=+
MSATTVCSWSLRAMSRGASPRDGDLLEPHDQVARVEEHVVVQQLLKCVLLLEVHADVKHEALEDLVGQDLHTEQAPEVGNHYREDVGAAGGPRRVAGSLLALLLLGTGLPQLLEARAEDVRDHVLLREYRLVCDDGLEFLQRHRRLLPLADCDALGDRLDALSVCLVQDSKTLRPVVEADLRGECLVQGLNYVLTAVCAPQQQPDHSSQVMGRAFQEVLQYGFHVNLEPINVPNGSVHDR